MSGPLPRLGPDERKLILNCARRELDVSLSRETTTLLGRRLAWDVVLGFAELHGVAPLLHRHLGRIDDPERVPVAARRRLLQIAHRAAYRNLRFAEALRRLLELFADGGVPAVVLKGLGLAELIYGNQGLRPLGDLNVLIPRAQLEAAIMLLAREGYRLATRPPLRRFSRWRHSQLHLVKPSGFPVHLLLQWEVVNWPRMHALDLARFWGDAEPSRVAGGDALVPSPIDLILYLCLQADRHGYLNLAAVGRVDAVELVFAAWSDNRLIRFTDLAEAIRGAHNRLAWPVLVDRARAEALEAPTYTSLYWVTRLYGVPIELGVLAALGPVGPRRLRRWLFRAVAGGPETRLCAWWGARSKSSQLRLVRLLDLLEFVFPRRPDLARRERSWTSSPLWIAYLRHVGAALCACLSGVLPWLYCQARRQRPSSERQSATPRPETRDPIHDSLSGERGR